MSNGAKLTHTDTNKKRANFILKAEDGEIPKFLTRDFNLAWLTIEAPNTKKYQFIPDKEGILTLYVKGSPKAERAI